MPLAAALIRVWSLHLDANDLHAVPHGHVENMGFLLVGHDADIAIPLLVRELDLPGICLLGLRPQRLGEVVMSDTPLPHPLPLNLPVLDEQGPSSFHEGAEPPNTIGEHPQE